MTPKNTQPENIQETGNTPREPETLRDRLADITELVKREEVELSPEMKKYFSEELGKLNNKLANGEPLYAKDMEFIAKIKTWILIQPLLPVISKLKARFEKNKYLHKGVEWAKVEESLKENPEALWSVNEMEKAGHEPDVYNADKDGFDIGTCSKESPKSGRNCVYDKEAAEKLRKEKPGERFNGNAVEMAKAMKIDIMTLEQYKDILQAKGEFDNDSSSWLKTPDDIRKSGAALSGDRADVDVYVSQGNAASHFDNGAWRGSLRVLWKKS